MPGRQSFAVLINGIAQIFWISCSNTCGADLWKVNQPGLGETATENLLF